MNMYNLTMTRKQQKKRLDILMAEKGLVSSRERAQKLIRAGSVLVDDRVIDKPGTTVDANASLRVKERLPYVSRGGLKLQHALDRFSIDVRNYVVADIGASTGGFTDCLLQYGAARVYAIDVGYGQLAWKLRQDDRVVVMERTNARHLDSLPELIDMVVIDASFISLELLLPTAIKLLIPTGSIVALIKPQFEAGKDQVGKKGVVKDPLVHQDTIDKIVRWAKEHDLRVRGLTRSPLQGPAGNVEFLIYLSRDTTLLDVEVNYNALLPLLPEQAKHEMSNLDPIPSNLRVIRRSLRSGQRVEHDGDLIIIGNVNPGAEVVAAGDIVVWGSLRGLAHAGYPQNNQAAIYALHLAPAQLRIGQHVTALRGITVGPSATIVQNGVITIAEWETDD